MFEDDDETSQREVQLGAGSHETIDLQHERMGERRVDMPVETMRGGGSDERWKCVQLGCSRVFWRNFGEIADG